MTSKLFIIRRAAHVISIFLLVLVLPLTAGTVCVAAEKLVRPEKWAIPVTKEGLPNFYRVSDNLYRGAQPSVRGFEELRRMGVRSIVTLRKNHSDEKLISGLGFNYVAIPVDTMKPKKADFEKFLGVVRDPSNYPIFVHCREGADRTGVAVVLYRIKIQSWDTGDAIMEMKEGGFGHHRVFSHLIAFIRKYDR